MQQPEPPPPPPPGMDIQSWIPCSRLGSGSSALVSLALCPPLSLLFALKSPLSPSSSPSLLHELRLLLPLSSPFILRCYGADSSTTPRHLFLEFMEGGSLSDLLHRSGGRLAEPLVRLYARSVAHGLEYLHQNRIVHCDIKGKNILIGSSGVKIADFGAAKRICSEEAEAEEEASKPEFKGTPLWMAPEVVQGVEQGFPSDIWSFGCTVVELLQGCPPWGHISDMAAAMYKLGCSEEAPPLPDSISDDARDFVLRCLQRNPKARWTATELLQHPFLCKVAEEDVEVKQAQLTPRSTLNFMVIESDSEDGSDVFTVPNFSFRGSAFKRRQVLDTTSSTLTVPPMKRQCTDVLDADESKWITVKRAASCYREEKKVPFMKSPSGGVHIVRRGGDVSLEAAMFLKNRKVVVG